MPASAPTARVLAAAGYRLGIVSNAQFFTPLLFPALLGAELPELGFDEHMLVFSYLEGEAKPSPALFTAPLRHLRDAHGIGAGEVLYVGNDMKNDISAGASAGCRTCLFAGDARSLRLRSDDAEARGVEPERVITDLGQLLIVLEAGGSQNA
jgi:putative hydrolase of the HAD superfamily